MAPKKRVRFKTRGGWVSFTKKTAKKKKPASRWRKLEIRVGDSNQALSEHRSPEAALIAWRRAFRDSTSAYIADYDTGEDVTLAVASLSERDREVAG